MVARKKVPVADRNVVSLTMMIVVVCMYTTTLLLLLQCCQTFKLMKL